MVTNRGIHIRGNRISGNRNRFNEKAIKILSIVKFNPTSITREEIMQKSSFSKEDVERQVKLLLHYQLIKSHNLFPIFPKLGWRVYTESIKHNQIIQILRQHGYNDENSERTREILDGYYPTCMALEGEGKQPNNNRFTYPKFVPTNEDLEYKEEVMKIMEKWKNEYKPFRPKEFSVENIEIKRKKFEWILKELSRIYKINKPILKIGIINEQTWNANFSSSLSNYSPITNTITLNGKFSVVTFLHEFGHARGFDEVDATLWSYNLYKRTFPVSSSRMGSKGHMVGVGNVEPFNLRGE